MGEGYRKGGGMGRGEGRGMKRGAPILIFPREGGRKGRRRGMKNEEPRGPTPHPHPNLPPSRGEEKKEEGE